MSEMISNRLLEVAPRDVTLYIMRTLCDSPCLFTLGQCCHRLLLLSRHVDLPHTIYTSKFQLGALIRDRWESDTFFDDMNEDQQSSILHAFAPGDLKPMSKRPKVKCRSAPPPRSATRKYQIGRLTDVVIPSHFPRFNRLFFPRMYLLATVRAITIEVEFNVNFQPVYPPHLTRLTLSGPIKGSLAALTFPANDRLREINLLQNLTDENLNEIEQIKLPASLHRLRIAGYFNARIDRIILPAQLQELEFNGPDMSVEHLSLPEGMTRLLFKSHFNHLSFLKLRLPSTLTHIALPPSFNQPAMRDWIPPPSLTRLEIPSYSPLRGDFINLLPSMLIFTFPYGWSNFYPPELINFRNYLTHVDLIRSREIQYHQLIFPPSVTSIYVPRLNADWNPPPNLRQLIVGRCSRNASRHLATFTLPATLTRIRFEFPSTFDFCDIAWPAALECISLGSVAPCRTLLSLPASLKRIELDELLPEWLVHELPTHCLLYAKSNLDGRYNIVNQEKMQVVHFT